MRYKKNLFCFLVLLFGVAVLDRAGKLIGKSDAAIKIQWVGKSSAKPFFLSCDNKASWQKNDSTGSEVYNRCHFCKRLVFGFWKTLISIPYSALLDFFVVRMQNRKLMKVTSSNLCTQEIQFPWYLLRTKIFSTMETWRHCLKTPACPQTYDLFNQRRVSTAQ